ncbi:MAG: GntR family transcriptional regulator [Micrococcales bacterium]|nr:GntR family transcriptional regulator [Micrococcales bacterium]
MPSSAHVRSGRRPSPHGGFVVARNEARSRGVDRASDLPFWAQVRDDLALRIASGEFSGHGATDFPGEMALSEAYGVSRQTVRQALRSLRANGTLVGPRGRPPRVADPALIHQALGALHSLYAAVEAAGLSQRSIVRALEITTDAEVAGRLHLPPEAPLLHLERVRLAGEVPLAHDHAWLPGALTRPLLERDFTHTALYTELAVRCGIRLTGGSEEVRAVVPSPLERELLGVPIGSAALSIERMGRLNDIPTELRRTVIRGDRFALHAEYGPAGFRLAPSRALRLEEPSEVADEKSPEVL